MSQSPVPPALAFTGERFTPECVREIWYEHWHRYAFATRLAAGRRVLDAACGEGYGSALLADSAASVVGVDIDPAAIAHARNRYGDRQNLSFASADVTALELPAASFDLIVSFETLEHVLEQDRMLAGFARLLRPDGLLLVSSPDKATYSDAQGQANPFHLRELYRHELQGLLQRHFRCHRLMGQKLLFQSLLWEMDEALGEAHAQWIDSAGRLQEGVGYPPLYYLALCAQQDSVLAEVRPGLHCFGDQAESVYAHYNQEVRRIISAGEHILAQDAEIARLRAQLAACQGQSRTESQS